MVISVLPFPHVLVTLVQFGYPLLCSLKVLRLAPGTPAAVVDLEYAQWTVFWVLCAAWAIVENNVLWLLVEHLPLYMELKLAFFLWLVHPDFKGAAYIWYGRLQQLHLAHDSKLHPKVEGVLGVLAKAKMPDAVKTDTTTTVSDKENVVADLLQAGNKK
eukprot:TRINITY_DN28373_c0_g1_i1.p2 TRINITY_DN28373_c0_g1~~TRINITY_DN28373_c0_g1_i1.p2  ORF type:complete len:186 (-),score=37.03 TRINITY_DN28373_c0_g1_i1:53-529(-)